MKSFSKFLEQVNFFCLCLSSITFPVSHIQPALIAVLWNFTQKEQALWRFVLPFLCSVKEKVYNHMLRVCVCVCVWMFVCTHGLVSRRTSRVLRSDWYFCQHYGCSWCCDCTFHYGNSKSSFIFSPSFFSFLFIFYFLAAPWGMQDPSSPTRDRTHAPCSGSAES